MKTSLVSILTERGMMRLAGERFFERGRGYFVEGCVLQLSVRNEAISAQVRGTYDYQVKIWVDEKELAFGCDCPIGRGGAFCKHCVAVGLSWLDRAVSGEAGFLGDPDGRDVRSFLMSQEKSRLVELLLERTEADALFEQRLQLLAAAKESHPAVVSVLRKAIEKAIRRRQYVEYDEMYGYVRGIDTVVDSIEDLLRDGRGLEGRELTEYALRLAEKAMNAVDDSDGYMGGIFDRLEKLHYESCKILRPDPVDLAKFLFEWETTNEWTFCSAAETYADILGESGLAAYKTAAESAWKGIKPLSPGEEDAEQFGRRFRITEMMEKFAEATGDVETVVAIKKHDLSSASRFLAIAGLYKRAGQSETAMEWAERGLKLFPRDRAGLIVFLIAEYHTAGRHTDAAALSWERFAESQQLNTYQELKKSADYLAEWPAWRERALQLLRESIAREERRASHRSADFAVGNSLLVEILLWEGNIDDAWKEANLGGCWKRLWMQLAEMRSTQHPADAADIYIRHIEPELRIATNATYLEAVDLLRKVKDLKARLGRSDQFDELVLDICIRHKRKRNLMKLFLEEGW